jgi:hypothetical protein
MSDYTTTFSWLEVVAIFREIEEKLCKTVDEQAVVRDGYLKLKKLLNVGDE